ncbi:conserved hypothetical protein [Halorhabdus tiamatea SARL4B]|uniref:Uncharacterized protein n=1 Tax=Halorhabdus tiamatea SARL4B TaxID=1033806 RepID=S6CT15_9EURY|nr:conserved hypothetical protein [Halorhabdus tiamatea SARL4B]
MDAEALDMTGSKNNETYENRLYDVAEKLQIPDSTLQITRVRLDHLRGEADVDAAQFARIAPTVLALSCREDGLPITGRDIVEPWVDLLADPEATELDPERLPEQIEAVADRLDIDHPPERPDTLVERYADSLDLSASVGTAGKRILTDVFREAPRAVAEASSPAETAGASLVLAAEANGVDGIGPNEVGDVGAAGGVTIKNRYKAFREVLDEGGLDARRYQADAVEEGAPADTGRPDAKSSASDGGVSDVSADACMDAVRGMFPDELPTTATVAEDLGAPEERVGDRLQDLADRGELTARRAGETVAWIPGDRDELGADLTIDAVHSEVDALVEALDVDASVRLFARGLVSDAAESVAVEDAAEFAGAALIASSRINDGDLDPATVARERGFGTRVLYQWLDRLGEIAAVDIPRRGPSDVVEALAEDVAFSETVLEDSRRTLEQYEPAADHGGFAAPELAAGAVFFAATTGGEPIDAGELADSIGFEASHVTDAMNTVFVSLCRGLIRGEIDYEESFWTADLLESDRIADIGDPRTGRAVAAAKTYVAGREGQHVDESTLDVLLAED